uniref:Uncharacterized protein n=2 Tax=Picea TaxID=3328 RepID=A0A117NJB3_PICGL|nr:hypothetical protein ABT39_MTgene1033 [Picea glauca]QHR90045.1 hypothetical protein Q903MT_gene4068 [Picea sitchensis]
MGSISTSVLSIHASSQASAFSLLVLQIGTTRRFDWDSECMKAFDHPKDRLVKAPILVPLDRNNNSMCM